MLHLTRNVLHSSRSYAPLFLTRSFHIFWSLLVLMYHYHVVAQPMARQLAAEDYYTPGRLLDTVVDNMGNRYTLGDIAISRRIRHGAKGYGPSVSVSDCSSGYFQMYLDDGCGFEGSSPVAVARRNVLCQVMKDISLFINSPLSSSSTGQKINISVRSLSSLGPGAASFAGVASSFFNLPSSGTIAGIADNAMWITLTSGSDAYTNVASPLSPSDPYSGYGATYFHGMVAFQFDGSINWHTDLATPPGPGERDLYSVALHEMLHALGFASLIDYNGNSRLGTNFRYYSRYDRHLQTQGGVPLITNTGVCDLYNWGFNSSLTPFSVLSPGGTTATCPSGYNEGPTVDHTACASAVMYAGSTTQPVYTPSCYEKGSSLSHFEDECWVPSGFPLTPPASNNQYFVMSNSNLPGPYSVSGNPGAMKRYPSPEERMVLCDIGYSVNTTFGSAAVLNYKDYGGVPCPGLQVAGINDGLSAGGTYSYFTTAAVPITISGGSAGSILDNDFGAAGFTCLEVLTGGGTVSFSSGTATTVVTFTPGASSFGVQLLRYVPVSSSGAYGNITYVYVFVGDAGCTPVACDLVANGSFENVVAGSCGPDPGIVHCWSAYSGTPDLMSRGVTACSAPLHIPSVFCVPSTDVHELSSVPNDHCMDFTYFDASATIGAYCESAQSPLTSGITSGNTYTVSFWAKMADNPFLSVSTLPSHLLFALSPSITPLAPVSMSIPALPAGMDTLCSFVITHPDNAWHYYSRTVTYSGSITGNTLILLPAVYLNPPSPPYPSFYQGYFILDDVSIKPFSSAGMFTLPDTIYTCSGLHDLNTGVSVPGGTFRWQRDSSGVIVGTDSALFDPVTAYNATFLPGGDSSGTVVVSYTYTDLLGCTQTVYAETHIVHDTIPPVTAPGVLCRDSAVTLVNAAPGGTWLSSDTAVAIVDSVTGAIIAHAAGTAVISYVLPNGCFASVTITVEPQPITGPTLIDSGAVAVLSDVTTGGTWRSGNAAIVTIDTFSGAITGIAPGIDMITYTTPAGCMATLVVTVTQPAAISQYLQDKVSLSVTPNPNKGSFTISGILPGIAADKEASLEILDMLGRPVYACSVFIDKGKLSKHIMMSNDTAPGIYHIRIVSNNWSRVLRFMVE